MKSFDSRKRKKSFDVSGKVELKKYEFHEDEKKLIIYKKKINFDA